jgi:hypothetical protein
MGLWVRFEQDGADGFGLLEGDEVHVHTGDMFASRPWRPGGGWRSAAVRLQAPVRPRKFIGLWNNFHALAASQGSKSPNFRCFS